MTTAKSVLITGCSSGIGRCVALGLHARGYRVLATARKAEDAAELQQQGLTSHVLDLDDSQSILEAVDWCREQTDGDLFALFNNGAYGQPGAVEDLSRQAMRAQFETNVFGTMELTNRVIPLLRAQGQGRIIQNSSILGLIALPFRGAYNASKFALEAFTDTLRLELRHSGIYVSLIEPGPILSRFRQNSMTHFFKHIDVEHSPHKKRYEAVLARLKTEGPAMAFTLPPEAVLFKVIHALEAKRPKIRYYVTVPTYLMGYLKRWLPDSVMDRVLTRSGGGGRR